jgi:choline dehydrogenase-like flavoprotein
MKTFPHTMGHIVLCREEATGRVYVDHTGKERISYVTGTKEREWLRNGFEGIAKLLHAQGAEEIYTGASGLPIWRRNGKQGDWANDQSFLDFLEAYRKSGFDIDLFSFGSAHQMGTCRMSGSARKGVVDVRGKVWGVDGLYVADASVFPSASGVNPMITTMAFGEWIGRRVVEGLVKGVQAEEVMRARL